MLNGTTWFSTPQAVASAAIQSVSHKATILIVVPRGVQKLVILSRGPKAAHRVSQFSHSVTLCTEHHPRSVSKYRWIQIYIFPPPVASISADFSATNHLVIVLFFTARDVVLFAWCALPAMRICHKHPGCEIRKIIV